MRGGARALVAVACLGACAHAPAVPSPVRVLIVDGQNNHDWRRTTAALVGILRGSGRFAVTVSSTPEKNLPPEVWAGFTPAWDQFHVVVSNYNGELWPEPVRRGFEAFIAGGGGAVMVHAANNPFPDWPAFNQMIGLGWRRADYGDRITIDDGTGAQIRTPRGEGPGSGHGPSHEFVIDVRAPGHPIMAGLPRRWRHGRDQLSHGQRGPAAEMTVLDSAFSAVERGGTGQHEPVTWVIPFGQGRVVTTMLGHQWRDQADQAALDCVGFQTVFARSVEWAATRAVTLPVPPDFPR